MAKHRATPHTATGETPNYLALGQEVELPDMVIHEVTTEATSDCHSYAVALENCLAIAHTPL